MVYRILVCFIQSVSKKFTATNQGFVINSKVVPNQLSLPC